MQPLDQIEVIPTTCLSVLNMFGLLPLQGPGNSKRELFLTGLEKVAVIIYSLQATEIEFSLFTRGRNVCCAQLFSSYHHSPQPPSSLVPSCPASGLRLSGKELHASGLILSTPPLR